MSDTSTNKAAATTHKSNEAATFECSAPKIQRINGTSFALAALLGLLAIALLTQLLNANARAEETHRQYDDCFAATVQLMDASDYLTTQSQMHVLTGDESHMNQYLTELLETKRRDEALATLRAESGDSYAVTKLEDALNSSNALAERELYAMRLAAEATGTSPLPGAIQEVELDRDDAQLPSSQKTELAKGMLLGAEYNAMKSKVTLNVDECANALMEELDRDEKSIQQTVSNLMVALLVILILLVGIIGAAVIANYRLVMRPMRVHARNIRENEPLEKIGSYELQYVVSAYNTIYEENHRRTMLLQHEAETDALTNLLNRGSYDKVLKHHGEDIALVVFDVDLFKSVNDTYGHDVGDKVLKKVAASVNYHFRTTDYVCRIGGDEFAVVMTEIEPSMRTIIESKLDLIRDDLIDTADGLPAVTISAGIAFSAEIERDDDIYRAADKALYDAKHRGRNTQTFYGDMQ